MAQKSWPSGAPARAAAAWSALMPGSTATSTPRQPRLSSAAGAPSSSSKSSEAMP